MKEKIQNVDFDRLKWEPVDFTGPGVSVLTGCEILDAECIDWPLPDGLILYTRPAGGPPTLFQVLGKCPADMDDDTIPPLQILRAVVS